MTTTLTIIRYPKRYIFFALLAMMIHRFPLWLNGNIVFFKLMGSGKNGSFDKNPDWQQWAILSVTKSRFKAIQLKNFPEEIIHQKLLGSFIRKWLAFFKCQTITYILTPIEGHGRWDGKTVFGDLPAKTDYEGRIAVLTRATIRITKLSSFWSNVGPVAAQMQGAEGLVTSYGIGEIPFIKQATFSIWDSKEAMKSFAYQMQAHKNVVQQTRKQNWYSEEMFVRFIINGAIGSINGINLLKGKL